MENKKIKIEQLISKNQFKAAISQMEKLVKDEEDRKDLMVVKARYNRTKKKQETNSEQADYLDIVFTQIAASLLDILNRIEGDAISEKTEKEILISSQNESNRLRKENEALKKLVSKNLGILEGKRLFQYKGLYPINLEPETDRPSLNKELFNKAIDYFLREDVYDRLAASDIVYLRKDNLNHQEDILAEDYVEKYAELVDKYDLTEFIRNFKQENHKVLSNYIRIIDEFGQTLQNCGIEILLHNVRNPLRSVVAAQNTANISTRKLYDPSTRFVVEYVKYQGKHLIKAFEGEGKISYEKKFKNGKIVKATTTPVFDSQYGLIGIICINIDVKAVKDSNFEDFINAFCHILTTDEKVLRNIQ